VNDSRPAFNLGSVLLAIVMIAGLGVYLPLHLSYRAERESASDEPVRRAESQKNPLTSPPPPIVAGSVSTTESSVSYSADESPSETVSAEPIQEQVPARLPSPVGESSTAFDPEQSSFEAAFNAAYWDSSGWKFDAESMLSEEGESTATFRRAYARFMFECQIEPQDEMPEPLHIRLKGRQPNSMMTLAIDGTRLVVIDDSRNSPVVLKEETISPALPGEAARLKLAATGNRLIVTWNGRAALTCNQIAGQSRRAIRFEFATGRTPWRIRDLRIEGE
jgi:hypothetical protein